MTPALALAMAPPMVAGYLLSGLLRSGPESPRLPAALRAFLAMGWSLGLASCVYFGWLVGGHGRAFVGTDLAIFGALAALGGVAGRSRGGSAGVGDRPGGLPRGASAALAVALAGSLAVWVAMFVLISAHFPHGGWDAMAIWNLRARFLFLGGESWAEAFHPAMIASHLDYPLLVPASVARCWAYLGREAPEAPAAVALAFALATVGLLVSALAALRGRTQGMLGGLVLLASPAVFELGSKQYADIPLAYYFLATVVCLALADRSPGDAPRWSALAGTMAGFAAWTKNEGLLFLAAVVAARVASVIVARGGGACRREALSFAAGLVPVAAMLVYFKVRFTPPNDFLASQGPAAIAAKLADPSRYLLVGRAVAREVVGLGGVAVFWLAAYRLLLGGARRRPGAPGGGFAMVVLALMGAGYVVVYVATPLWLPWHLQWSLVRLIVHLWPLAVFAFFLAVATPEEALAGTRTD